MLHQCSNAPNAPAFQRPNAPKMLQGSKHAPVLQHSKNTPTLQHSDAPKTLQHCSMTVHPTNRIEASVMLQIKLRSCSVGPIGLSPSHITIQSGRSRLLIQSIGLGSVLVQQHNGPVRSVQACLSWTERTKTGPRLDRGCASLPITCQSTSSPVLLPSLSINSGTQT
jgi:hypothetical protein